MGVAVKQSARPQVACVILSDGAEGPKVISSFDLKAGVDTLINQIDLLGKALGSQLSSVHVDAVVIRTADFARVSSRRGGPASRLLLEGALGFVARSKVANVSFRTGKDIGVRLGISKEQATTKGASIEAARPDAAAAALSGFVTKQL